MARPNRSSLVLAPYVPRLVLEWAETAPEERWRQIDGSLVFVDISGFTALSERLARRGRQGAEELTGTLSACFAELLAVAYSAGGSLLKFGGDALLLLFDGPEHASRAAASAVRMRSTMAEVGRVTTSVGNIRLRMSVGVHSGSLHLFRVGESHRELIITGPGVSTTVDMEGTAQAGEIVVSPATAAQIDPSLIGPAKGPGVLLRKRAMVTDFEAFPPAPAITADVGEAIPMALRDHLAATVEPEHRDATIAFVHFDEIDGLIETEGAGAAADALDELTRDVQAAVEEEGVTFLGSDVDHDGGKIILVGGAPRSLGDDVGRMLRAVRRVADGRRRLPTRIGVNRGHVFVGEVGPAYRRTYTVMGDTVNLAARLMAKATAGQVLATGLVLDQSMTEFEVDPLPPFMVKGKAKPVEAFAVGVQGGRRSRERTDELPFTGRDRELITLVDALEGARAGLGGLVELRGDAGIGKSRLVAELKKRSDGVPVISSFCETYEAKTPYFAARYLVRGALGIHPGQTDDGTALRRIVADAAPDLLPWLPLIAAVVDVDVPPTSESDALEPQFRRVRTRQAVVELLGAVARTPLLFLIEDGQWIDTLSAELLVEVATAAKERPWLVCLVRRPDADSFRPDDEITTERIVLGPLDAAASLALVAAATKDAPLRPHEREAIIRQAGGNPLFLEELLRSAASMGAGAVLPDSLEALVATQIDRLAPDDRRLLRYAAVLGPMFEADRLADLVDGEIRHAPAAVRRLRTFLEPAGPGWLRFRNQCYRQVAYETLAFGRRRELHARAGASIERSLGETKGERAEILSYHFLHAQDYDRCWRYAVAAARQAEAKYANVEAAELYERALVAGARLGDEAADEVAAIWEALGDVCLTAGILDRAKLAFTRARQLRAGDRAALAVLCKKESTTAMDRGERSNEVRWINRGLRLLDGDIGKAELVTRSQLRLLYGEHYQRTGRYRQAVPWCDLGLEDAIASGDRAALAGAYVLKDLVALDLGKLDEVTHLPAALSIWEELDRGRDQATVLTVMGAIAYYRGQWDEALALFDRGRDAYLRIGDVILAGYDICNVADILIDQGRGEDAVDGLHEVLDLWRSVRHSGPVAGALLNLGRCALQRRDFPGALQLFEEAKASSRSVSAAASIHADAWLAECLIHSADAEVALPLVDAALRTEASTGSTTFLSKLRRVRGYACSALGRTDEAFAEFDRSLEVARSLGAPYDVALTLEAIANLKASIGEAADPVADAERRELLEGLGVRATFAPPLLRAAAASA